MVIILLLQFNAATLIPYCAILKVFDYQIILYFNVILLLYRARATFNAVYTRFSAYFWVK